MTFGSFRVHFSGVQLYTLLDRLERTLVLEHTCNCNCRHQVLLTRVVLSEARSPLVWPFGLSSSTSQLHLSEPGLPLNHTQLAAPRVWLHRWATTLFFLHFLQLGFYCMNFALRAEKRKFFKNCTNIKYW